MTNNYVAQPKVYLVHGWEGSPKNCWFPWLSRELESRDFKVDAIKLPHPETPTINDWVDELKKAITNPDENTFLVGHSMGCQTIARYLEQLPQNIKIGGAVFVAGFFKRLTGIEDNPEEKAVEKEWLTTPLDLKKVKSHLLKSIAIFSDDDPYVPLDNQDDFKNKLGSKIIIEKNKGHFSDSDQCFKLPIVLESILKITK